MHYNKMTIVTGQGLNTGVLLLDLEKMRNNSEYKHFTTQVLHVLLKK